MSSSGRLNKNEKNRRNNHIIQIDKSTFSKRKYNIGRNVYSLWIVGDIDWTTKMYFLWKFIKRFNYFKNIILENVELGSTMFTDKRKGCAYLSGLRYNFADVTHITNFIDSITGANVLVIVSTRNSLRNFLKKEAQIQVLIFRIYFNEFMLKKIWKYSI